MSELVLIHGAFAGAWSFRDFAAKLHVLGHKVRVVELPERGIGADRNALAQLGIQDFARHVETLIEDVDNPVLIGHSMGGLIAQILASRRPIAALVLLAPAAPWGVGATKPDETAAALALYALGDYWNRALEPEYSSARRYALSRFDEAEAARMFQNFGPESGKAAFQSIQWWRDLGMNSAAPAYRIKCPVLAVAGSHDLVTPASTVRRIAERFPKDQATFVELPGMGHWLIGEPGVERVVDVCADWLDVIGCKAKVGRQWLPWPRFG